MIYYDSCALYISSTQDPRERIKKIDLIIDMLMTTGLSSAENADVNEYSLDDGQSKIKTVFNSPDKVISAINGFEKIRNIYINRINGRVTRLVPGSSIINGRG